ncbi:type II toxin-antitoxin system RelE/ParE family toxin [Candidatus Gracilibacteria bacterium]|nr:type II toxin-antitoxin system RelE/ParE family toxin [Candidatus Gracilibacteria bacterium]
MFKIIYSDLVKQDLIEISNFISIDNPFYATKVVGYLTRSIDILKIYPLLGKERRGGIREIIDNKYKYRIFYKINGKNIYIISIFKYKNIF